MIKTLKMILLIAVLFPLSAIVGCNSNTEKAKSISGTKNQEVIKKALKLLASRMRSTLPRRINVMTTMVDVQSSELTLTYFYIIEDPPLGEIDEDEFYERMVEQLTEGLCTEEKVLSNLKNGVTYSYNYQDNDGSLIAEMDFTIEDCEDIDG
ncbi:MAG: hypothetical protein HN472_01715 [Nitrospina sp.]|jgi:hypothetical protein|nr:hypothetical protein [Nitrospina sp.]MBT3508244.1 hypothetical protein [Nitrospina sp.]MBT3874950.1 hypothetical protein [Nitrospina sp.]MBT4047177.1 hypothetical protein [Nitrospina sp.]MBT4557573.1 hypothetical protein [Nitrospina sp.]